MEEKENGKLDLVKSIFESQAFRDLTQEEQRVVVNQIIETGELPADEIEYLYVRTNTPWLEQLPYDLFVRFVLSSGIKGKDIINLCNSSPILNDYCNRNLILEDGTIVDQYLFRLLLQRDRSGIPYEKFLVSDEEGGENEENPRETYKQVVIDRIDDYTKLLDLLDYISETSWNLTYEGITNFGINKPNTLEDLLYSDNHEQFGLLDELVIQEEAINFNEDQLYLIQHLHYLIDAIVDELTAVFAHNTVDNPTWDAYALYHIWQTKRNPSLVIKWITNNKIDLNLILNKIRQNGSTMNVGRQRLEPLIKVLPDNNELIKIMMDYNAAYRIILNEYLGRDYQTLKLVIVRRFQKIINECLVNIDEIPEDSDDENTPSIWSNLKAILLDPNSNGLDFVLDYLIELHNKILTGQLDVTTRIKDLIK